MEDLKTLLRLHLTGGIGMVTFRKLVRKFGSPEAVLAAPTDRLAEVDGIGPKRSRLIAKSRDESEQRAARELEKADKAGVTLVPFTAPSYPLALRKIYDPPLVLYLKGSVEVRDTCAVAIVGARRCSAHGRKAAADLAEAVADAGFTVISGLAYGIDGAAHAGALRSATGRTLAVLGSGVDTIYPEEHTELAGRVVDRGALISEFPLGSFPARENFPKRNRVISGLSLGVLVVEGTERSGSLITARFAAEQGKELFAVPGRMQDRLSRGPHALIKDGAKLVESVDDILAELGPMADDFVAAAEREATRDVGAPAEDLFADERLTQPATRDASGSGSGRSVVPFRAQTLTGRERSVYDHLSSEPLGIDDLIYQAGLPPQEVAGTLMVLEIKRLCKQLPGKQYVRLE